MKRKSEKNEGRLNQYKYVQPDARCKHRLAGRVIGRLTVLGLVDTGDRVKRWLCSCECGGQTLVLAEHLRRGTTRSCGCLQSELTVQRNYRHGESDSPEYRVWAGMVSRCSNKDSADFLRYGGRGISVCPEWRHSFVTFLRDVGRRPSSDYSIERIDVDGDYEPANCRWATKQEQADNKTNTLRFTIGERTQTLTCWAREYGLSQNLVYNRVTRLGWDIERALSGTDGRVTRFQRVK